MTEPPLEACHSCRAVRPKHNLHKGVGLFVTLFCSRCFRHKYPDRTVEILDAAVGWSAPIGIIPDDITWRVPTLAHRLGVSRGEARRLLENPDELAEVEAEEFKKWQDKNT